MNALAHAVTSLNCKVIFQSKFPEVKGQHATILRQAIAGLLWSKQFYHYIMHDWLQGDPDQPEPPSSRYRQLKIEMNPCFISALHYHRTLLIIWDSERFSNSDGVKQCPVASLFCRQEISYSRNSIIYRMFSMLKHMRRIHILHSFVL